jgi:hypothetical protein
MVILIEKRLREKLAPFNQKYLDIIMGKSESDENFRIRIYTPIRSLPKYAYLVQDERSAIRDVSLMDIMFSGVVRPSMTNKYFSFSGDLKEPIGFLAYRKVDDCIEEMILFSFLEERSGVIVKDFNLLIKKELPTVKSLKWKVNKNNLRAIQIYDKLVKPYGGKRYPVEHGFEYMITRR